ncbi:MAG: FecR family protein, partial [Hoylesella buccalis]
VIFLPVALCLGTWFVASNQMASQAMLTECHVENGQTKVLRLSDGTQVRLNAGSSLFYPQRFNRFFSRRDVYLDGEAHFDVAKNSSQPFIVHVGNLKVKVLGTHFNVKAYPAEELVTTTLEQGKVKVYEDKIAMTLLPDEQAVYNRISGKMTKRSVDSGKYNQWMNGKLLFDQTPLKVIIADLQRRYNVSIKATPAVDLSQQFTMAFRADEGIDDVMKVLTKISGNLDYIHQQHTITLNVKKGGHKAGNM